MRGVCEEWPPAKAQKTTVEVIAHLLGSLRRLEHGAVEGIGLVLIHPRARRRGEWCGHSAA